jgi:hypothetical protein
MEEEEIAIARQWLGKHVPVAKNTNATTEELRITGFFGLFHRLVFWRLENTTFRKLDLFPSSGERGRHLLSWVPF